MPAASLEAPTPVETRRPPRRLPPWSARAALAVYAVLAWVCLLSFPEGLPLPRLDSSWSAVVVKAAAEHWAFGREIMLNFGPWAHLGIGFYYAPLFTAVYLFQLGSKAVLVALICRVGYALPPVARGLFFAASLATGMLGWEYPQMLAVLYAGWSTSEDRTRTGRAIGAAGVVLAAAAGLVKTFFILLGQGVFVCVLARQVVRGRGRRDAWLAGLWPLGLFEGCLLADWRLAGQSFADLPAYLHGVLALTEGHSSAMGYEPTAEGFFLALTSLVWTGGLGLRWFAQGPRETRRAALPLAALAAGGLFLGWKQGVTRADPVHLMGFFGFVAVLIVVLPLFLDGRALPPVRHLVGILGAWTLGVAAMFLVPEDHGTLLRQELAARPAQNLGVLLAPADERARLDFLVARVRERCALPQVRAAVGRDRIDFLGTKQGLLVLNDLNYAPVPTVQGFLAYTPYLAALDAACYAPGRAPAFVLYKNDPLDGHWPMLDGARQLRETLWNYEPVLTEQACTLLRRKPAVACLSPRPVLQQHGEIALDAPLPLPPDGADWCELEVHPTLLGRLVNFLYHAPPLLMEATTRDGTAGSWTLPPGMAQGGFLLRQPPSTPDDLGRFTAGQPVANPVTTIRLGGGSLLRASVGGTVTYRFYHLDPPRPSAP